MKQKNTQIIKKISVNINNEESRNFSSFNEVREKAGAKEKLVKRLTQFIIENDLDVYTQMDIKKLAEQIFERIFFLREDSRCHHDYQCFPSSDSEIRFNYIFNSFIKLKDLIKNKSDAITFFEEGIRKIKSGEFDRFM